MAPAWISEARETLEFRESEWGKVATKMRAEGKSTAYIQHMMWLDETSHDREELQAKMESKSDGNELSPRAGVVAHEGDHEE